MQVDEVAAHLQCQDRYRQNQPDPEPPSHIDEFRAWPVFGGHHFRLERHPADRAVSWANLPYLRRCMGQV